MKKINYEIQDSNEYFILAYNSTYTRKVVKYFIDDITSISYRHDTSNVLKILLKYSDSVHEIPYNNGTTAQFNKNGKVVILTSSTIKDLVDKIHEKMKK